MLSEYIDSTNLSLDRYRKIVSASKNAGSTAFSDLINGKITGNQFIERCLNNKSINGEKSFEEIYSEIKDTEAVYQAKLNNTADLFNKGVEYLEEIVQRVLSDEYINTFDEADENSRTLIEDCLDRINQIHTVISSLI